MLMKDKPFKDHRAKHDVPAALPLSAVTAPQHHQPGAVCPEQAKRTGKYTVNQIPSPDHQPINITTLLLAGNPKSSQQDVHVIAI